ncbi:GNAT family N-acetyltransferase [Yoonia sediminilitoris]|uniref:RimJ/RimL family protein N-acetyltransferase n=1 Tax=Yoonia sediminilitoris TaxID=1286148 RepID=A0A2T6KCK1_9RHOB|nr:GNAT family N-acetyltransferase [Yoonia sediminilitoris]PUB12702.1 RimJ/RimL family protein N-acetyltransferase [Yoonia sediminilitoris]RCW94181.1 RimJ/RimL family protein N-acetyltransferase [Yoonia sediminilitoris]
MTKLQHRFLQPQNTDALHDIVSDWDVVRQLEAWPWPPDRSFTQSRCRPYDGDGFVWGIFEDDVLLGIMGVTKGDIGYCFRQSAWGRGIATHFGRLAINFAFQDPALTKITASCWHDNEGSDRVLHKLSFCQLGEQVQHAFARDEPTLCYKYLLTRTHWDGLRSRGEWTIAAAQ